MTMITCWILWIPVRPASDCARGVAAEPLTCTGEVQAASAPDSRPAAVTRQKIRRWLRMIRNLRGGAWAASQATVRAAQRRLGISRARPRCYSGDKHLSSRYGRMVVDRGPPRRVLRAALAGHPQQRADRI